MQPGQRIGKYVLGERIAVGGMAEVWAARVEGPQGFVKPLALKFMLESFSGDSELERLFVNEARVAAQLQHANIVSIFDFDKIDPAHGGGLGGRYYIAMERVEGRDLRQIAVAAQRAGNLLPRPLALHLAGEVLKGLRYVHERRGEGRRPLGLIHRDVSPHNVLVSFTGEVKLSDFGIAKTRAHTTSGKVTGNIRGKLAYASPEQLDDLPLDHRTDQFALGVTLWELLAGRRLFDGRDEMEVMNQVSRCEIPPLADLPASRDIAPAVDAVVRRMLARRVEDRFPTTAEALSAVLSLPGYTADSVPLGNLVRGLFGTQTDFPATTAPLLNPPPEPLPDTMTMQARPAGGGSTPSRGGDSGRRSRGQATAPTKAARPSAGARSGSTSGVTPLAASRRRPGLVVAAGLALAVVGILGLALWQYLASSDDSALVDEDRRDTVARPTIFVTPTPGSIQSGFPQPAAPEPVPATPEPEPVPNRAGPVVAGPSRGPAVPSPPPPAVIPAPALGLPAPAPLPAPAAAASSSPPPSAAPSPGDAGPRGAANAAPIIE